MTSEVMDRQETTAEQEELQPQDRLYKNLQSAREAMRAQCNKANQETLASALREMAEWLREGKQPPSSPCPRWLFWSGSNGTKTLACQL